MIIYIFAALYGISIGSFLNVLIYRIPRGESFVHGRSHCPSCGTQLRWVDLIPVFSYVSLKGQCRYCGSGISVQYPVVELITGSGFVAVAGLARSSAEFLAGVIMVIAMITGLGIALNQERS